MISSLISPITQQALELNVRRTGDIDRAFINVTDYWYGSRDNHDRDDRDISRAVTDGQFALDSKHMEPSCPTGNCSFDPFQSLALCTKMQDISEFLTVSKEPFTDDSLNATLYRLSLPNNVTSEMLHSGFHARGGNSSLVFGEDEAYPSTLANYYLIYTNPGSLEQEDDPMFIAFEIIFYVCVNEYETVVSEGEAHSIIKRSSSIVDPNHGDTEIEKLECFYPSFTNRTTLTDCSRYDEWFTEQERNMTLAGYSEYLSPEHKNTFSFDVGMAMTLSYNLKSYLCAFSTFAKGAEKVYFGEASVWLETVIWGRKNDETDPKKQANNIGAYFEGISIGVSN